MKKLILAVVLAAFASDNAAHAADMPVSPAYKAPIVSDQSAWTGFYIGGALGGRATQTNVNVTSSTFSFLDGTVQDNVAACVGGANASCILGDRFEGVAFRVSPYVGYNWQFAPQWVAGIEGDWGWASQTTTRLGMQYPFTFWTSGNGNDSFAIKTTWDASLRARMGYLATPSVLLFVTGGAAWLHVEATSTCNKSSNGSCQPGEFSPAAITNSKTLTGWTIGGGVDAMLSRNWILRAEYRYADFGAFGNTDIRVCSPTPSALCGITVNAVTSYDVKTRSHTASVGIAYRFDWTER